MKTPSPTTMRDLLFADLSLDAFAETHDAQESSWKREFRVARRFADIGDTPSAIQLLLKIANAHELETRIRLWAWSNLRRLGEQPTPEDGAVMRGVVLEVRMSTGLDTLAAYQDRTARFLSYSGRCIVWDSAGSDGEIDKLCDGLLSSAVNALTIAGEGYPVAPQLEFLRATFMTFGGTYSVEATPQTPSATEPVLRLFNCGAMLMQTLIKRASINS